MMISVASCYKPQKKAQCPSMFVDGWMVNDSLASGQTDLGVLGQYHPYSWMDGCLDDSRASRQTDRPRCSRPIKGKYHPYSWMISYGLDRHLLLHGHSPNNGVDVSADDFIACPNHLVIFDVCSPNNAMSKNGC
jgi:hypothetical protein